MYSMLLSCQYTQFQSYYFIYICESLIYNNAFQRMFYRNYENNLFSYHPSSPPRLSLLNGFGYANFKHLNCTQMQSLYLLIKMSLDSSNSQSYKDLIKENKRLNSQLRKIGTQLTRNHNYSSPKILEGREGKVEHFKNVSAHELEKLKSQQLKSYKVLKALEEHDRVKRSSTYDEEKQRKSMNKLEMVDPQSSTKLMKQSPKHLQKRLSIEQNKKLSKKLFKIVMKQKHEQEILRDQRLLSLIKNSNISHLTSSMLPHTNQEHQIYKKNLDLSKVKDFSMANIKNQFRNQSELLGWIRQNIIGFNTSYISAVHLPIQTVYVDHTATNRPFKAVEVLVDHAKLFAANPHTQFSRYGKFSTELMHYARDSLLKSFSASGEEYVVLPTGGGSTGAIQKAVHFLKNLESTSETWKNPKVFFTPYEHHSNILPWVEFYEAIEVLAHNQYGTLNMEKIFEQISQSQSSSIIITVSGASNVTSKITHLDKLNHTIKKLRAALPSKKIVFSVDCAAFCCHQDLNLSIYDQIDFAFLSPHKNLGGAESCGVLVARKSLMASSKPTFPGGGTVRFVKGYSKDDVMYEVDIFSREIAGTPPYFGFYRAALSFQLLRNTIGYPFIHDRQVRNTKLFFSKIEEANKKMKQQGIDMLINIYGEKDLNQRANVVTFNFQYGHFQFVQHSFASLILTDIFGIQIRSGCFCAGPYGIQILLKVHSEAISAIEQEIQAGIMINKPGYLRLDLTFYLEEYQVEYIANAIILIARYWKNFLKLYTVCNDGQIILLPIFVQKNQKEIYSLTQIQDAYRKLKQEAETQENKLRDRKKTLEEQLKIGQSIAKNPVEFLKKIKQESHKMKKH